MHWDHADGADLFPKAEVWIQKDEFNHYTHDAKQPSAQDGNDELNEVSAMVKLNAQGPRSARGRRWHGEIIPGVTVYTGGRHTFASQYVGVTTKAGRMVIASDNLYLYENLDKHVAIAQTLDAKSNLAGARPHEAAGDEPAADRPWTRPGGVRWSGLVPGNGVARVE